MAYTTRVISIGDLNLEAGSGYAATLVQSWVQPDNAVSRVAVEGRGSVATAVQPGVLPALLHVWVATENVAADTLDARRRALIRALDSTRGPVTLTVENETGTARRRWMRFVAGAINQVEGEMGIGFMASVESADADPRWQSTATVEATWALDDGMTVEINNPGDLDARPTYTLQAGGTKAAGNFVYRRWFRVGWQSFYAGRTALDVTGGGLNTAALKTAGKVTTRNNMAVYLNGRFVPFWYGDSDGDAGGFNSTSTRMWVNLDVPEYATARLDQYVNETATLWRVADDWALPASGLLDVEGEIISYTSRTTGYLYGVTRGLFGTTAAEHEVGSAPGVPQIETVAAVGYILYGPSAYIPSASKPAAYLAEQPPMVLGPESTNAAWRFGPFAQTDRPQSWWFTSMTNNVGFVQGSAADGSYSTTWAEPWGALGIKAGWTSAFAFQMRFPMPIKSVWIYGRHMGRGSPAQAPGSPRLLAMGDAGGGQVELWDAAQGARSGSNEVFSKTLTLPGDGYTRLEWRAPRAGFVQADIQVMVVTFQDRAVPIIALGSEDTGYDLDLYILNQTTGEELRVELPDMIQDKPLVIDSELQTVTYDGRSQYAAVQMSGIRPFFLRLAPGSNTLSVVETGMGDMNLTVRFTPRWYA